MPKSPFTLALAADKGTRMLNDHARYRDAYLHLSNVELANAIRTHPNADAGLSRLLADIQAAAPVGDVTEVPLAPTPVLPATEDVEYGREWDGCGGE